MITVKIVENAVGPFPPSVKSIVAPLGSNTHLITALTRHMCFNLELPASSGIVK